MDEIDLIKGTHALPPLFKELTGTEFIALNMKMEHGTFEAACFLKMLGWNLERTRELLCITGRNV